MLTKYEQDGLELLVDETGAVFASIGAAARMIDKHLTIVSRYVESQFEGVTNLKLKTTEIDTTGGKQGVTLLDENLLFGLFEKYKPSLLTACAKCGLRLYLHGLVGIKYEPVKSETPLTNRELILLALAESDRAEALAAQIEADKGKTLLGAAIEKSLGGGSNISIGEFAKQLAIGRNKLFVLLREIKFLMMNSTIAYQSHLEAKRATVIEVVRPNGTGIDCVTLITPKGQTYIIKKLKELEAKELAEVAMEREVVLH